MNEKCKQLIDEGENHAKIIRSLVRTLSSGRDSTDDAGVENDFDETIKALNYANRQIYRHIDNLRSVCGDKA